MASDANASTSAPVKASGGASRVLLIGMVAANMIGLAVVGAYVALRPELASAAPAAHAASSDDELGPLVEFESMVVNLSDRGGGRYLKVTFQMEVASPEDVERVRARTVPIRDGVLGYLGSLGTADVAGAERVEALRARLLEIVNERTGAQRVRRLYFTEYLVQ